jgi:hypothetical protein
LNHTRKLSVGDLVAVRVNLLHKTAVGLVEKVVDISSDNNFTRYQIRWTRLAHLPPVVLPRNITHFALMQEHYEFKVLSYAQHS